MKPLLAEKLSVTSILSFGDDYDWKAWPSATQLCRAFDVHMEDRGIQIVWSAHDQFVIDAVYSFLADCTPTQRIGLAWLTVMQLVRSAQYVAAATLNKNKITAGPQK